MNTTFPRVLTLLRKERGISQKQSAADREISQALLSHYVKGIRHCGLDFVVRVADYYNVSCDYLLGRTADQSGAMIAVEDLPDAQSAGGDNRFRGSVLPVLNKKLLFNSINILFDLLQRSGSKALTTEVSSYLMLAVYTMFRQLYAANPKNPDAMFSVPSYLYRSLVIGEMSKIPVQIEHLAAGHPIGEEEGLTADQLPAIVPDRLVQEYPLFATSLLNLLKSAEERLK